MGLKEMSTANYIGPMSVEMGIAMLMLGTAIEQDMQNTNQNKLID